MDNKKIFTILGSVVGLVVVSLLAVVLLVDKPTGSKPFTTPTYPFSFDYPEGWTLTRSAEFTYGSDASQRAVSVSYKEPFDKATITEYKLNKTLPANVNGNLKEVNKIVATLTKQAGGTASDAKVVKYGGAPGYQYVVEFTTANGVALTDTLTFLFRGNKEYQVNCQSTPKNTETVNKGCDQILSTLKFN